MNYLDRLKEKFPNTPPDSTAKTAKRLFAVFAVGQVGTFSENADPQPEVMPAEPSTQCPAPNPAGNIPYRLNVGNVTQLVWLPPGLEPADVLTRAKAIYPDLEVTDSPPLHGWPCLADIPEVPRTGAPQPVEVWTPAGKRLRVTAASEQHAEQIRRMNPPPQDDADRLEAYEERAAIMEYDGGLSRQDAERKAGTCYYCRHWRGTKSGKGYCCIGFAPPVARNANESCEQFTLDYQPCQRDYSPDSDDRYPF